jgi:hypothetical protein
MSASAPRRAACQSSSQPPRQPGRPGAAARGHTENEKRNHPTHLSDVGTRDGIRAYHGDIRRALIGAALQVIATDGLGALSLRDLARHAGVSHAAPIHHFRDKAGLLTAVATEGFSHRR